MKKLLLALSLIMIPLQAHAFCGFFVSKADADLFNEASKVVLARGDDRTVITMANDYKGDLEEFAIVIPVPTTITESQINVTENKIIDHLDAYTAPRLVEYHDPNPCAPRPEMMMMRMSAATVADGAAMAKTAKAFGVTIEEQFTKGEYDILVLSAQQSDGLLGYLNQEGYKLPEGAERVLGSYIKQNMKFFLAKVNLEEQAKSGYTYLRPLQVAYESEKFMLPIRLGTLNAQGDQEIILFTLTQNGRVEPTNYRTVKIPSDMDIPFYIRDDFGDFYTAMFETSSEKEGNKVMFLEYAWDMGWCDPCAADPVPNDDLRTLGAWWVDGGTQAKPSPPQPVPFPGQPRIMPVPQPPAQPADVFVTRLHAKYNADTFPEDILLQETSDRQNFQGRYVMRNVWTGEMDCEAGEQYLQSLPGRFEKEAQNLAGLTGWDIAEIRETMNENGQSFEVQELPEPKPWWERMWGE